MKIKKTISWILLSLLPIASVNADRLEAEILQAYQTMMQTNSINVNDLSRLAISLENIGELDKAIEIYQKILTLELKSQHQTEIAAAYNNLGLLYQKKVLRKEKYKNVRGQKTVAALCCAELDKAIEMFQKSLQVNETLGNKEGMARNYADLGSLYRIRGELDKAIEMLQKALQIDLGLDRKESVAEDYLALGNVYKMKGNKAEAKRCYQQALELYNSLSHPSVEKLQNLLDTLE